MPLAAVRVPLLRVVHWLAGPLPLTVLPRVRVLLGLPNMRLPLAVLLAPPDLRNKLFRTGKSCDQ